MTTIYKLSARFLMGMPKNFWLETSNDNLRPGCHSEWSKAE
ncbi:MAG TPA: hypothetical protein PLK12_07135 [Prolixibacteraceae bacterium]|nr:hypothetical protein [Prolixibacteraceae bacterium]